MKIDKEVASNRAKKAWETKRKNGTGTPWNKDKKGVQVAWNKNLTVSDPRVAKYTASQTKTSREQFRTGARKPYIHTPEINRKMAISKMGDKNPSRMYPELGERHKLIAPKSTEIGWQRILKERDRLVKEGNYDVIVPITMIIPDMLAIKIVDGKIHVTAIEVETTDVSKEKLDKKKAKYDNKDCAKYYDEIIWIVRKKKDLNQE